VIREQVLLDDGVIVVADVRCVGAQAKQGPEEVPATVEVVIPLDGVFLWTVRRPGSPAAATTAVGDSSRALVFRPGEPYRVAHPIGGADRSIVIGLRAGWAEPDAAYAGSQPRPGTVQLAARRLAIALAGGHADALTGAELALALVDAVAGRGAVGRHPSQGALRPADLAVIHRVRLEILAGLAERTSLPELGRRTGLSSWELARRFRRATGTSIHAYRTAVRVQAALERIEGGEHDLTALALDLGFADHSHLTNVLRREVGRPPSAFRRRPDAAELMALRTILQA
jgi:AraC-like DNA-binding protein